MKKIAREFIILASLSSVLLCVFFFLSPIIKKFFAEQYFNLIVLGGIGISAFIILTIRAYRK